MRHLVKNYTVVSANIEVVWDGINSICVMFKQEGNTPLM